MFNLTYCFLGIFIFLSAILGSLGSPPRLSRPMNLNEICRYRGGRSVDGACRGANIFCGEVGCLNLYCALRHPDGGGEHVILRFPTVNDGTVCAPNRVCDRGVCVPSLGAKMVPPFFEDGAYDCLPDPRC